MELVHLVCFITKKISLSWDRMYSRMRRLNIGCFAVRRLYVWLYKQYFCMSHTSLYNPCFQQ